MRNKKSSLIVIFVLIAGLMILRLLCGNGCFPSLNFDRELYAVKVIDGDTIELSNGERVRYIGIDTPELKERDEFGEWVYNPDPYAEDAKDLNRRLVGGNGLRLEFDVQKRDRYDRLLAYVYAGDKMVNLEIVKEGYAMVYTYPPNIKYTEEFLKAQRYARENKKGLWSGLENGVISGSEAGDSIGFVRTVETTILDTYLSEKVLVLSCTDKFKVVIFRDNLSFFPKTWVRSPDTCLKHRDVRVYGLIKDYKGSPEIVLNDPSQLEIL